MGLVGWLVGSRVPSVLFPGSVAASDSLGVVQRVDAARLPTGDAALVRTRAPGATHHLLVVAERRGTRIALVDRDALGTTRAALRADRHPQELAWRVRLEGARIVCIEADGALFEREGARVFLTRDGATLVLRVRDGDATAPIDAIADDGATLASELAVGAVDGRRAALARAVARAITKVERRADAVRGDLARIGKAEETAASAQLFVAEAARVPRGARTMSVVDWSSGEAKTIEMALDPARSAREQLDAVFKRARRLKDGGRIGRARLADAEATLERLRTIAAEIGGAVDLVALDAMAERARRAAPRDFRATTAPSTETGARRGAKGAQPALPPYRTFRGARGAKILVGRGAAHNDELTLHVAKPHDLWLHARGHAGAHVVVPLPKGASCPPDLLADAAHLAAHFSRAKDETAVEIAYVPRRYVRKPRGSAAGLVVIEREKVFVLRREEDRLRVLLESEEIATER